VTYQLWKSNPWQVIIALIALAIGYVYWALYLYPRRATRWTMPAALSDDEMTGEAGALLNELEAQPHLHQPAPETGVAG
jgi:hypothetical protein